RGGRCCSPRRAPGPKLRDGQVFSLPLHRPGTIMGSSGGPSMSVSKEKVMASIAQAKQDLDQAIAELEKMPAFDPGRTSFTAHALHNYLQVAGATLELLEPALAGYADP